MAMARFTRLGALALASALAVFSAPAAMAAEGGLPIPRQEWSFDGPFGTFDRAAAQRGFQVYKEVCASCHALSLVAYRNLEALGLTEAQVKALASEVQVTALNDDGEMAERAALPSDRFKKPFPNEAAARAANNGAYPPDLSLIVKARTVHQEGIPVLRSFGAKLRQGGADYVYALLTGYADLDKLSSEERGAMHLPQDFALMEGMSFNKYFPGHQIAMAQPLHDEQVTYADGAPNKLENLAHDVVTFLAWAAEPQMEARKRTGVRVVLFLGALAILLYLVKRRVWAKVKH